MEIYGFATRNSVTCYWEKPPKGVSPFCYHVLVNGEVRKTEKTHLTIEGLNEGQKVSIGVVAFYENGESCSDYEPLLLETRHQKRKIDVSLAPYFAVGDGKTLNTEGLQQAFDDCKEDTYVYFPKGDFLTGALRLHSHMELYLDEGARLLGTQNPIDYEPRILSRFEGTERECYQSLLNIGTLDHNSGYNCEDILIHGKGTIESGGAELAKAITRKERELLSEYLRTHQEEVLECENADTIPARVRGRLINISNARNVIISGLCLKNAPSWNVHMIYSDHIITNHCTIESEGVWNGDGWDPDSSTNCTLFDCVFHTGDDAVAIKSGKNPEGLEIARECAHIKVFDCFSDYGHGIVIGSEMSGGVRDVRIWDCDMGSSMSGFEVKATKKRGGYVKDIHIRDSVTSHIMFHSVSYNDDGIGAKMPPMLSDCSFTNVRILGKLLDHDWKWRECAAIEICGFDVPGYEVSNIHFANIKIESREKPAEISLKYCNNITFEAMEI